MICLDHGRGLGFGLGLWHEAEVGAATDDGSVRRIGGIMEERSVLRDSADRPQRKVHQWSLKIEGSEWFQEVHPKTGQQKLTHGKMTPYHVVLRISICLAKIYA